MSGNFVHAVLGQLIKVEGELSSTHTSSHPWNGKFICAQTASGERLRLTSHLFTGDVVSG